MPIQNLLFFQRNAIEQLNEVFIKQWKKTSRKSLIVFKSPTGSGKTLMAAHFIRGLNHLPQWDEDKAFIWITFSDDLAMQSRDKFKEYFDNNLENGLLTVADINQGVLKSNDILFLNWQKVVSEAAENRVLRRPQKDDPLYKERGRYFEDVIDQTKAKKREIILIIDEAHKNKDTRLAQTIIDYIDPKIILHITATPEEQDELEAYRQKSLVEVERDSVVAQGLIKEKIVLQSDEDLKEYGKKDLDETLLNLGIEKREQLKSELKSMGKDINPLMLIQLPNDDKQLITTGDKTKEEVTSSFLKSKGIPDTKIAKWFDKNRVNLDDIAENDCEVDYLLFKQAAGTGWDCPRASVLVMFREIKSKKFYTQTVGRILRMPEPHIKDDYNDHPALRLAYLYTNYKRKDVEIPDQSSENKPLAIPAMRKEKVKNVELPTTYASRIDYGDIPRSMLFQKSFINSMNKSLGINSKDILGKAQQKLKKKGVDITDLLPNRIVANAEFEDFDELAYEFVKKGDDVSLEMSTNDVEKTFNYFCYKLLQEQNDEKAKYSNIARSWSVLKSAIRIWLESIFGKDSDYYYRVFVKDIQRNESSVLRPAITKALADFKPIRDKLIGERKKKAEDMQKHLFTILDEYRYTEDYKEVPQKQCVLDKFYALPSYRGRDNEMQFKDYIDTLKEVDWWFKNGDYGKNYLAIPYYNSVDKKEALFYPDWIIRFKDGRVGIFDTKDGKTGTEQETEDKAKFLAQWIKQLGKKYIGGITIFENGIWYYNDGSKYKYIKGKSVNNDKNWKKFEELL